MIFKIDKKIDKRLIELLKKVNYEKVDMQIWLNKLAQLNFYLESNHHNVIKKIIQPEPCDVEILGAPASLQIVINQLAYDTSIVNPMIKLAVFTYLKSWFNKNLPMKK